ncbi:hypothetical protein DCCM_0800 [Desulfocucumis palustris]|uniref:HTH cro/C1-type domain-containing protein n=1 Tax=Desulfocucumis palustris TaxID=1898651 RepID=A0A2L2X9I7_9FIRM|nr:helix-turn-helix transcriptional regulator [Desulfocucumis palustris]GBF32604.1 hypothetical protein DCCM_0800 [Desulfocucumis palustris]
MSEHPKQPCDFGIILKSIRESRMMTQKDLAEQAGIAQSHLNKIEKGNRMPSDQVLYKLAEALMAPDLFISAGRMIPTKFEEMYPKPKGIEPVEYPTFFNNLANFYHTTYKSAFYNEMEIEDKIKDHERLIDSLEKILLSSSEHDTEIKISTMQNIINNYCEIVKYFWNLKVAAIDLGKALGKKQSIDEIINEFNKYLNTNLVDFLVQFTNLNPTDADIIADIIQTRKNRQKEPS